MKIEDKAYKLNLLVSGAILFLHILVLVIMPLVLLPRSPYWAVLLLPLAAFNITHWALIHEGVHKNLIANGAANDYISRGLSILMGASFHVLKFPHLMHHKLNREWQSEIVARADWKSKIAYYWSLVSGLYVTEILLTVMISLLPKKTFLSLAAEWGFDKKPEIVMAGDRFFTSVKMLNL